ncbi:Protein LOL1 [Vitis vinifera]|uniref:Protein LOL1 n=1 Tax=Vitis vinifera TaxID=29760 RepID=A0A438J7G8_VITVI|nr:Protein LOL1 [Vitis vinifera]
MQEWCSIHGDQLTICILFTMLFLYSLSHNLCNVATDFLVNHCDQLESPKFINDPAGLEMAQLICGGCRTLLMYTRGATSVRCSCCHTVNLAPVGQALGLLPNGHQFESPQGHWRFTRSLTSGPRGISRGAHKLARTSTQPTADMVALGASPFTVATCLALLFNG